MLLLRTCERTSRKCNGNIGVSFKGDSSGSRQEAKNRHLWEVFKKTSCQLNAREPTRQKSYWRDCETLVEIFRPFQMYNAHLINKQSVTSFIFALDQTSSYHKSLNLNLIVLGS